MNKSTGLLKITIFLAVVLTVIQMITGSNAFTMDLLEVFQSMIATAMPIILVMTGIYILIRCLF
ncbi:MAG: hypothetical protein ACI4GD_09245 [Lachnospiraceae bacterium]